MFSVGIWTVWEFDSVTSTNLGAAELPAWSAARAETQTDGRGRYDRKWISDQGGLWLSAVVPVRSFNNRVLPLLAGLAVCDVVRGLGVEGVRLRWPNDVMVGERKLAGVLVEPCKPGLAVLGIGLNVNNQPARFDPSLQNRTERLADLWPAPATIESLMILLLERIRSLVDGLNAGDVRLVLARVNDLWSKGRQVELDLEGEKRVGCFAGVEGTGRILLLDELGSAMAFDPEQVRRLTESPESCGKVSSPA
jgi:BirA family transcriptional regulator, biotin operon repressor / biotin---[acetyl-CoA-carboxylase] ligase